METPVIAIVGRPNVGKSTLFNVLTRTRQALVYDTPGVTRDRQYGHATFNDKEVILIDTGGMHEAEEAVDVSMLEQVDLAIEEADLLLFILDGRAGIMAEDIDVANRLRQTGKPLYVVVNKTDGIDADIASGEFYALGLGEPFPIAAAHQRGTQALAEKIAEALPETPVEEEEISHGIRVAVVGRPNAGKSTLINRILGEERVIVMDLPGTTRDSIYIPFERRGQEYTLIDTAGVRRRAKIKEHIEKFSVSKTLQAIEDSDVVVYLLDAHREISEQDMHLLDFTLQAGRSLVIAVNKWDGLDIEAREKIEKEIDRRLNFVDFAEIFFISALHGSNVGHLFEAIQRADEGAKKILSTNELTKVLQEATTQHQPPVVGGRRIKLRYAHSGGHRPQIIVIHGKKTNKLPGSYKRYLQNTFRKQFKLVGCPIRFVFNTDDNPYG